MPSHSSCNTRAGHPIVLAAGASIVFRAVKIFLALAVTSSSAFCQSPAPSQPTPPPQQSQPPQKGDASSDTAKKADKDKPKPKRVLTEEDLANLHGGVSVVGDSSQGAANSAGRSSAGTGKTGNDVAPMSGRDESYWRGRAKEILDEMAALDQEIAKTKDDIKKYGADGFDAQSGYKNNVVYIDNRASKLEQLEKRKSTLEKQLDQLQEEGRKAGADPAWFR